MCTSYLTSKSNIGLSFKSVRKASMGWTAICVYTLMPPPPPPPLSAKHSIDIQIHKSWFWFWFRFCLLASIPMPFCPPRTRGNAQPKRIHVYCIAFILSLSFFLLFPIGVYGLGSTADSVHCERIGAMCLLRLHCCSPSSKSEAGMRMSTKMYDRLKYCAYSTMCGANDLQLVRIQLNRNRQTM